MNPIHHPSTRLHDLDAVRAFALLLGVIFHASLSFMPVPIGWAVMDVSTSPAVAVFALISHSFRMPLFFLIAGYFGRMTCHRNGARAFLRNRAVRLGLPFVSAWWILWPLIVSGWIMGAQRMQGDVGVWASLKAGFSAFADFPKGLYVQTHLWFLYYLMLMTLITLGVRAVLGASFPLKQAVDAFASRFVVCLAKPFGVLLVALPTAGALWFMHGWGMDTPDKSLVPNLPVLLVYGGFFQLGWALHRQPHVFDQWIRPGRIRCVLLVIAMGATLAISRFQGDPSNPHLSLYRLVFAVNYALMMASLVFITIGLFRRWMSRYRPAVRYIADASYWIYLIHLPIVVWFQVAVANWPLHWSVKWGVVSAASIGLCLLTYALYRHFPGRERLPNIFCARSWRI